MTRAKEFAEGYISFWYDAMKSKWHISVFPDPPTYYAGNNKYFKIKIPIPDELLFDELPDQDRIEVKP